jgi:uroporphyrin-III C-methyltransferase
MSRIFLVGAGPGDPQLLTVKAYRLLQQADVILHDDLVSPEVLELAPKDAVVINVGKRCGSRRVSQEDIHALMVAFASFVSSEQTIVRLKGGDPMLFGRAAEEMEALEEAQLDYEVVPGVTAALAAAAQVGVSLTDRRFCSHVIFTTGHTCSGIEKPDWRGMVRSDTTVAIYMPGSDYQALARALTSAGLAEETPCVLISQIGCRGQHVHRSTLSRVSELPLLSAPVLFLAGNAVGGRGRAGRDGENDLVPQFVTESSDF